MDPKFTDSYCIPIGVQLDVWNEDVEHYAKYNREK